MPQNAQHKDSSSLDNRNNNGVIEGSGNIVNSGQFINQLNIQVTNAEWEEVELDRLMDGYTSKDALHNSFRSPPECYSGTRKTIRKEIGKWIDDSSSATSLLLWLNGPAGVGKSVIAKTIASHDKVVATFFFSTSSDRGAAMLFPTLAWQLSRRIPETRQHIITSLKNNCSLLTSEIKEQFNHLIVLSLKKCTTTFTFLPVMIIDGLDECTDEYMLSRVLQVLVRAGESGNMPLRFIICSRPEPRIRCILKKTLSDQQETEGQFSIPSTVSHSFQRRWHWRPQIWIQSLFPDISNGRSFYTPIMWGLRNPTLLLQEALKLYRPLQRGLDKGGPPPEIRDGLLDRTFPHPVVSDIQIGFSEESKEDIARYLADQFNKMGHQLGESDISDLVGRSCGQFLYASTIVRLLEDSDPKDVLEMVRKSSLPTPDLNKLYKIILKRAKNKIRTRSREGGPDYEKELGILMDTLAILVVFFENIHFFEVRENSAVIESLVGLEKGRLTKKLSKMNSVLNIATGKSISVHHRSFLEFLQTQRRSGEHYVAYPKALRRLLVLLSRTGLRYFVMDLFGRLQDNDRKTCEDVKNMTLACRHTYFKRSYSPMTMTVLHDLIHYSLPLLSFVPFCLLIRQLKESFVGVLTSPPTLVLILEYLLLTFFGLFILSSASFIISLIIYTQLLNHSFVLPLFHPFLHPLFVTIFGILFSSRQFETSTPLLEQYFESNAYPSGSDRALLAERTGLTQRQIDVWVTHMIVIAVFTHSTTNIQFQNHRNSARRDGRSLRSPLDEGMSVPTAANALSTSNALSPQQLDSPMASSDTTTVNTENRQQLNNYQGTEDPPFLKNCEFLHNYVKTQRNRLGELAYDDHDLPQYSNHHTWTSTVQLNGTTYGKGEARTKAEARELAAAEALAALQSVFGL